MRSIPIEDRVYNYVHFSDSALQTNYIPISAEHVKQVLRSKLFKENAIDGCPAYAGRKFVVIHSREVLSYD